MTVPALFILRIVVLASAAVIGSVWALVRHYTHPHPPMVVWVPVDSGDGNGTWDAGPGFIEAPDLEPPPPPR